MARRIIPSGVQRWQPQTPLDVAPEYQAGLAFALLPGLGWGVPASAVVAPTTFGTFSDLRYGQAYKAATAGKAWNTACGSLGNEYTLLVIAAYSAGQMLIADDSPTSNLITQWGSASTKFSITAYNTGGAAYTANSTAPSASDAALGLAAGFRVSSSHAKVQVTFNGLTTTTATTGTMRSPSNPRIGAPKGGSVANATVALAAAWSRYMPDGELLALLANPYGVFRPRARRVFFGAAAGGNTASVPVGSLSLAGLAPTVSATANQTATVPAAVLTLTGLAPTVSATANQTVSIPAASLTLTGNAPTVSVTANEAVTVPAASLALSGNAPIVSATQNQTASIPVGSLTLTGEIPTVTATQNQLLAIPLGSLALTGNIPAIEVGGSQTLDVPLGTLALIGNAPTVTATDNQTVGVPLGALSLAALAPSIASSANQRIVVPLAALTMTGLLPAITATQNQFVVVPVGTFTMVIYAPVLSGPLVRAPVIPKWLQLWYRADVRKQTLFLRSDVTGKQGFARSDVTENEGVVLTKSDDASVQ